jgi:predicted deacetylase
MDERLMSYRGKFLLLLILLTFSCVEAPQEDAFPPELWIEVHDISPGWGYPRLEQVIKIIDNHPRSSAKKVLFIIPNHANSTPLSAYPGFVERLDDLDAEGYIVGMHGYNHFREELDVSYDQANSLVEAGMMEFERSNLPRPKYFSPMGWTVSHEASELLRKKFEYVYYAGYIQSPNRDLNYSTHEYTWYEEDLKTSLERAEADYLNSTGIFRLVVHVGAVNDPVNLQILEDFLSFEERIGDD